MDLNNQAPSSLLGAVQQPNQIGALQQLLLSRVHTPQESQDISGQRQSGLEQYQASLRQPVQGDFTPTDQGLTSWVEALGNGKRGFNAVASGVAAGGNSLRDQQAAQRLADIQASKVGYDDAVNQDLLDSRELSALRSGAGKANGGIGGVEKILPLYGKIFNSYSQQAKDMQFAEPAERTAWIKSRTDEAVKSAIEQFGGAVSPAVLNQLFASASTPTESNVQSIGSPSAKQTAVGQNSSASAPGTPSLVFPGKTAAGVREMAGRLVDPAQKAEVTAALDSGQPILQDFPSSNGTMSNADRAKFSQMAPPGTPPFANKPNEALMNAGAKGMGTAYTKEYEDMTASAAPAKDQIDAYNTLEKIDPNTNAFANVQGYVGAALQGFGIDPNTPIVQDAIKNRQANTLISQMSNAALRGEKGVQTRSDEIRIGNELARTTDLKQAWKFLVQLGKERAQRKIDAADFAAEAAAANNGVPISPRIKFTQSVMDDPLTQDFGGKTIFRTPTIEAYMHKYPDADKAEAIEYWKSLEQGWKSRQRSNSGAR